MNGKTIKVSQQVYEKLKSIKQRNGHTSVDSVLRYLLTKAGEL
jgi:predicted CopG family antitoxin